MDAQLVFAFIIGALCGAIALAVVLLVSQALTPKEETKKEPKPRPFKPILERTFKLIERAAVRDKIATLSAKGMSQREIGRALGMHQKSVWRIMKRYGIKKA